MSVIPCSPALTAARPALTAELVCFGFSILGLAFVCIASAPQMSPRLLETGKALTVLVVAGCVAAADFTGRAVQVQVHVGLTPSSPKDPQLTPCRTQLDRPQLDTEFGFCT
jgi:hypothetical protein